MSSNVYPRHLNMLLRLSSQSDSHRAIICYLILRSVLSHLSGEHQVDAAQRILSSMGIQSLDVLQGVTAKATTLQDVNFHIMYSKVEGNLPLIIGHIRRHLIEKYHIKAQQPRNPVSPSGCLAGTTSCSSATG